MIYAGLMFQKSSVNGGIPEYGIAASYELLRHTWFSRLKLMVITISCWKTSSEVAIGTS